jgi:hypothetical protein
VYTLPQVLCLGLIMFASRVRSLRQLDRLSDDATFLKNWCILSRERSETVICSKQMTNVLAALDPEQVSALRIPLVKDLLRSKRLPEVYLLGHVMVASDGTGVFSSSEYHCDQCLTQDHDDGTKTYLHNMLETKIVGWNTLAISVLTEPLLNPADGTYKKQDCETKAFHRLLLRLKQLFPREPICHLLDSLYCQGPVFKAIADRNQKFICCFKQGSIPTLYAEALTLCELNPTQRIKKTFMREGHRVDQVYTWVNALEYQGLKLDFVMCVETVEGKPTTFAYLTNFEVTRDNVQTIADGGRKRWNIEEAFNEQKTGYELEHFCDCNNLNVMLCLYYLLQIVCLFMQLLARSNLIEGVTNLTHLAFLLLESWRNQPLSEDLMDPDPPPCQIRFAKVPG